MKGQLSISVNQATMLEAMQQYFNKQMMAPHIVTNIKKDSTNYSEPESFIVAFKEPEPAERDEGETQP